MAQTLVSLGPTPVQSSSSSTPLPIEAILICDMEQELTLNAMPPSSSKAVRYPTRPGSWPQSSDQLLQLLKRLQCQNPGRLIQIRDPKRTFPYVFLLQAHGDATYHNPLHRLLVHDSQAVARKPAVA
ncbi:hypothetical protein ACFX2A_040939 [Malus domestica]